MTTFVATKTKWALEIYNPLRGVSHKVRKGCDISLSSLAFSPERQKIVMCRHDDDNHSTLSVYDVEKDHLLVSKGFDARITSVAFSTEDVLVMKASEGIREPPLILVACQWGSNDGADDTDFTTVMELEPGPSTPVLLTTCGSFLITSNANSLCTWDAKSLEELGRDSAHEEDIVQVAVGGFCVATASTIGCVVVYDLTGHALQRPLCVTGTFSHRRYIEFLCISNDGSKVAFCSSDSDISIISSAGVLLREVARIPGRQFDNIAFQSCEELLCSVAMTFVSTGKLNSCIHMCNLLQQSEDTTEPARTYKLLDDQTLLCVAHANDVILM